MATSPLAVLGVSAALAGALLLFGASHWLYEKRTRMQRVRTAAGKAAGAHRHRERRGSRRRRRSSCSRGRSPSCAPRPVGSSLFKGEALAETRKLLVSAGYRSRDAIVVFTFFKLVSPLVFLGGGGALRLRHEPDRQGTDGRCRGGDRGGALRQQAARHHRQEHAARSGSRRSARRCPTRSTCW